jgi:hypothetical protein
VDQRLVDFVKFRLGLRRLSLVVGPVMFSLRTGHFSSAITGRAMDAGGNALPWYTYPAIRFLSQHDFTDADVLEFGGGQSTIWWAERARSVLCLDPHDVWVKWLQARVPQNATVHLLPDLSSTPGLLGEKQFDIIVVDAGTQENPGPDRIGNMATAVSRRKPGGMIVVDNSTTPEWAEPISKIAAEDNLARVDFIGFSPGGMREYGTSIYFKEVPKYLLTAKPPRWPIY